MWNNSEAASAELLGQASSDLLAGSDGIGYHAIRVYNQQFEERRFEIKCPAQTIPLKIQGKLRNQLQAEQEHHKRQWHCPDMEPYQPEICICQDISNHPQNCKDENILQAQHSKDDLWEKLYS